MDIQTLTAAMVAVAQAEAKAAIEHGAKAPWGDGEIPLAYSALSGDGQAAFRTITFSQRAALLRTYEGAFRAAIDAAAE